VLLRKRSFRKGHPNRRALKRWRFIQKLCRRGKQTPSPEITELAQKARFSAHRLTAEELAQMDFYVALLIKKLRRRSAFKRFYYTVILALY